MTVGASGLQQREPLRLPIGRRRQQDALNQTENRRGRADAQRQREHGDQAEHGLLQQHSHANAQILEHLILPSAGCYSAFSASTGSTADARRAGR